LQKALNERKEIQEKEEEEKEEESKKCKDYIIIVQVQVPPLLPTTSVLLSGIRFTFITLVCLVYNVIRAAISVSTTVYTLLPRIFFVCW